MLSGPSSIDSDFVNPITPHFAAAYGVRIAKPSRPAADEILTIEAFLLLRRCGTARRVQLNCPVRQISRQRSQSSGFISSIFAVGPAMPALLTSTSRPPSFASAAANRFFTAARSETSHGVDV